MALDQNDVGTMLELITPYLARLARDTVNEAQRLGQIPELHPATVIDTNAASGVIDVAPDGGGGTSVPASTLIGIPEFGSRVMLLYQPPAGVFVVGYIGARRQPHVSGGIWQRVVSQSVTTATVTPVTFDVSPFDSDGFVTLPGNTFTVPTFAGGRYLFTGAITFSAPPTGLSFVELIASPYSAHTTRSSFPGSSGESIQGVSAFFTLNDGDSVQLRVYQTSAGSLGCTGYLEAVRLLD